jgi:hypothetical protein
MAAETHPIIIRQTQTATVRCDEGDFTEDAHDSAEVPAVLGHGAMHAMALGHQVHEHVSRDVTVIPALGS